MTDSPIQITYPGSNSTVKGCRIAASGFAPTGVALPVQGVLSRSDNAATKTGVIKSLDVGVPTRWLIIFHKSDVCNLFKSKEELKFTAVLTVTDQSGANTQTCTFTIDRTGQGATQQRKVGALDGGGIDPDPVLAGTDVTCPFTSSGTEVPPASLYAFMSQPGGQMYMGNMIESPNAGNGDEFVFLWQNIPPGPNYTIHYQSVGPSMYATDGPFTVD